MKQMILPAIAAAVVLPLSAANAQQTAIQAPSTTAGESGADHEPPDSTKGGPATRVRSAPGNAEAAHHDPDQAIVVTGIRREAADVLGGVSVLSESELTREVRPSIGETLARQPGVSASSFGPTASAPVLRGLSGDRVRVLTDGIGSFDLSNAGPDHAVAINPLTAERIEVLRGPGALLFGSAAIGGVVNVIDLRIPRHLPAHAVGIDGIVDYGSAANERSANLAVDVPLGGHFVVHGDGSYSKTDDLDIGGYVLSKPLRRQALASADPAIRALADLKGTLPNSESRTDDYAGGVAYIDGGLNLGVSVGHHDSRYGVPIRYSLDPSEEAESPTIDAHQTRYDARAEIPLSGTFSQVRARAGYARYHHDELTPEGEVDTSFYTKGGEGRVDLVQSDRSGWGGTSGVQYLDTKVRLRGEEKFLPDSEQRQAGMYTLQTLVRGPVRLEAGVRFEDSKVVAQADETIGNARLSRHFTTVSGSIGASYDFAHDWRAGLSVSDTARAPSIQELYANGPHGGSESFEVGDPELQPERSLSVEGSLHHTVGPVHVTANVFYSRFSNYIFQTATGAIEGGLPVYQFRQGRANYSGFELQSDAKFGHAFGIDWGGELTSDFVRATVKNFGPAPLVPPFRILVALTGARGPFDGRVEMERAFAHNRTAQPETDTPAYTLVNAALDWHPSDDNPALTISLQGNNLFDVDARRSTSLLKDFAPLAGRDVRVSARVNF